MVKVFWQCCISISRILEVSGVNSWMSPDVPKTYKIPCPIISFSVLVDDNFSTELSSLLRAKFFAGGSASVGNLVGRVS